MRLSNLETVLKARPFRPFEIRVDGEGIVVAHPEQVFLAEKKATAIIDTGDRIHVVGVDQISKITQHRKSQPLPR